MFSRFRRFYSRRSNALFKWIATFDICAIFETKEKLNKTFGIYAKPIKKTGNLAEDFMNLLSNLKSFRADEYCTTEYSQEKMKLIKYSEGIWEQWNPIEIQTKLKWIEEV